MQYLKPAGKVHFVGDCMPFFHDGTFHLFYLLDEGHHSALGGLGGHQWAHASSTDLVDWTHHPLAIPITEAWEGSICTGSAFFHEGTYYGFYATRTRDRMQHLSVATSDDIIDVCIDNERCILNRCPELHGDRLFFFCQDGDVTLDGINIRPLL